MTKKIMLINETNDESRIAILEDNILQEMLIEHITEEQIKNNIYRAVAAKVQPSLQAAFVDFGNRKHGFLQNSEVNPRALNAGSVLRNDLPIQEKLSNGQPMLVQVVKEAVDQKGAVLSTNISLPGRFMVLMPYSNKGGISKKIEDSQERERLRNFLSGINSAKDSIIIRTAGMNRNLSELKKDYTALKKTWKEIKSAFEDKVKPGLIYREEDVVIRTLRDYYTNEIQEIWIDNPETYQRALGFFKKIAPRRQKILKLFVSDHSLFASYNIEKQVEQLTKREMFLKSGGSIIIDQTEALVAIDVNSGKSNQEENIHATALRSNLEAADEIARQLRLRNLGGLVVVDFIDMENRNAAKKVEKQFQIAMKKDKAQYKTASISEFGLMEISRQRLAIGIAKTVESLCPVCDGKGKIPSLLASTNLILRTIREMAAGGNLIRVEGELPLEVANHLLNECRQSITDLELEFGVDIILKGNPEIIIFEPNFLKPVLEEKYQAKQTSASNKKANLKPNAAKKRNRRQEDGADQEVAKENRNKPLTVSPPRETLPEKTTKENEPRQIEEVKIQDDEFYIYPSCLFAELNQLSDEEMAETIDSFEKRLKGEVDEESYLIDKKYLWDLQIYDDKLESEDPSPPAEKTEANAEKPETKTKETKAHKKKEKTETSEKKKKTSEKAQNKPSEAREVKSSEKEKKGKKSLEKAKDRVPKITEVKSSEKEGKKPSEAREVKSSEKEKKGKKSLEKAKDRVPKITEVKSSEKEGKKPSEAREVKSSEKEKSEKKSLEKAKDRVSKITEVKSSEKEGKKPSEAREVKSSEKEKSEKKSSEKAKDRVSKITEVKSSEKEGKKPSEAREVKSSEKEKSEKKSSEKAQDKFSKATEVKSSEEAKNRDSKATEVKLPDENIKQEKNQEFFSAEFEEEIENLAVKLVKGIKEAGELRTVTSAQPAKDGKKPAKSGVETKTDQQFEASKNKSSKDVLSDASNSSDTQNLV